MEVNLIKLAELIDSMTSQRNKLKEKNDLLKDIKSLMDRAWEDDTRWNDEGKDVVDRIIACNDETINLFSNTIVKLQVWSERLAQIAKKG